MRTKRDKVYIALKDTFRNIDDDLKTLNTESVEFLMFNRHRKNEVENPKLRETFDMLKNRGKVRLAGLTPHDDVKECMKAGIDAGFFSILMPVLNQSAFQSMDLELRRAEEKGIGVMAMKTMQKIEGMDLQLANLKKVLANPAVTTVLKGFGNFDTLDAFINAAKETLTSEEDMKLYRHARSRQTELCMACGECRRACPRGIEIPLILRSHQYYLGQMGDRNLAVSTYRGLNRPVAMTGECGVCRKCEAVCPNGIPISRHLTKAVQVLERESHRLA
jgi:predicted aldo/keto reductase-like oxidoreductase